MFQTIEGGTTARTLSPPTLDDQLPIRLREHVRRLKRIVPVISVSVLALKAQCADLDEDIASILQHEASEPLDAEIEDLEALLATLVAQRKKEAVA